MAVPTPGAEGLEFRRYKGLGEMTARQLRDTTLDPAHRVLRQVTLEDAVVARISCRPSWKRGMPSSVDTTLPRTRARSVTSMSSWARNIRCARWFGVGTFAGDLTAFDRLTAQSLKASP